MALIDSRNAGDCAGLVVENLIGDMRCNAEPGHPRYAGPAQIVKAPPRHSRELIQPTFCSTEFPEGLGSEQREDI
jgi:hypothetical protein